jgi:hypothetical protein
MPCRHTQRGTLILIMFLCLVLAALDAAIGAIVAGSGIDCPHCGCDRVLLLDRRGERQGIAMAFRPGTLELFKLYDVSGPLCRRTAFEVQRHSPHRLR